MSRSLNQRHNSKPEFTVIEKPFHTSNYGYAAKKNRPHYSINENEFVLEKPVKIETVTSARASIKSSPQIEFKDEFAPKPTSPTSPRFETYEISSLYRPTEPNSPRSNLNMIPNIVTPRRVTLQKGNNDKLLGSYYLKYPGDKTTFNKGNMNQNTDRTSLTLNKSNQTNLTNYLSYIHNNGTQIEQRLKKLRPKEKPEEEDEFTLIKLPEIYKNSNDNDIIQPRFSNILKLPTESGHPTNLRTESRESTLSSLVFQRLASYYQGLRKVEKAPAGKKEMQWRNNYKEFFMELAGNLHKLTTYINKMHKISNLIKEMCSGNKRIIELLTLKKITDYDYDKLVKKFSLIEEVKVFYLPGADQPIFFNKPSRNFQPSTKIEPQIMKELFFFNEQLEKHLILLKREDLKCLEDEIIQREEKLNDIHQQKLKDYYKNRDNNTFNRAEEILLDKPRIDPFRFFQNNPYDEIEAFQSGNGDARFIKKTTLETSKNVHDVFENWIGYISHSNQ